MYIKFFLIFAIALCGSYQVSLQSAVSSLLSKRHVMRTINHETADDMESMEYSEITNKGRRKTNRNLIVLLDQLAYDNIINFSQDTIVVIASMHNFTTSEVVIRCNKGIYCLYKDFSKLDPYMHFDSTEDVLCYLRKSFKETDSYNYALEKYMWNKAFLCNTTDIIKIIRLLGNPGIYELWYDAIWQIILKDGEIVKDELIIYDPLNYHYFLEVGRKTDKESIDSLIFNTFNESPLPQ